MYWVAEENANCPADQAITTKSECIVAAAAVGLMMKTSVEDVKSPAGCYKISSFAYFNNITDPESTTVKNNRAGICSQGMINCRGLLYCTLEI